MQPVSSGLHLPYKKERLVEGDSVQISGQGEGKTSGETVPQVLGLDREQVASVELLPEAKHVFSHVEWHMTGYRVVLSQEEEPLSCFMVSREELEHTYALPNAFNAYTKLIG